MAVLYTQISNMKVGAIVNIAWTFDFVSTLRHGRIG